MKQPPFACEKTYFVRDVQNWITAHPPVIPWTRDDIKNTTETIWAADELHFRRHYRQHARGANRGGLANLIPAQVTLPPLPYATINVAFAKAHKRLPVPIGPAAGPPPGPALAPPPAPVPAPVPAPLPPVIPSLPPPPPLPPANSYAFSYQPPLPWHSDSDATDMPSLRDLRMADIHPRSVDRFLDSGVMSVGHDNTVWRGARFLGAGSFGAAGLWVRVDEQNNIVEQLVVKDCQPSAAQWRDPTHWRDRLPREIAIHRRIDRRRSRDRDRETAYRNLAEHKGYRLMMRKRRYRLYQKYYAAGDLYKGLKPYFDYWIDCNNNSMTEEEASLIGRIPEGLVWHVFESLVKACLLLRHSTTKSTTTATEPDWHPITHTDIHMSNIFIEPANRSAEPNLPNLVLADYGQAFFPLDDVLVAEPGQLPYPSDNPADYVLNRLSRQHPPEICSVIYDAIGAPVPINEKTDVWMIGAVIWQLLTHNSGKNEPLREDWLDRTGDKLKSKLRPVNEPNKDKLHELAILPEKHIHFPSANGYSAKLKKLMRMCLHYQSSDRMGLIQLDRAIKKHFEKHLEKHEGKPAVTEDDLDVLKGNVERRFGLDDRYVRVRWADEEESGGSSVIAGNEEFVMGRDSSSRESNDFSFSA